MAVRLGKGRVAGHSMKGGPRLPCGMLIYCLIRPHLRLVIDLGGEKSLPTDAHILPSLVAS